MKVRALRAAGATIGIVALMSVYAAADERAGSKEPAATKSWKVPRTADGQPDLQGTWNSETYTPFERPVELKDKPFFTAEEAAAYEKRRVEQFRGQASDDIHYDNAIWQTEKNAKGLRSLRTSIVIDPADGRIPPLLPQAQKRQADLAAARRGVGAYDSVQNRPLAERCIIWPHQGPPMQPVGYNSNLKFVQAPGYVVVIQEMIHDARIIPLDNRPRLGKDIQMLEGDSRGHWDGDTLVVETTNLTGRTQFRGSTAALKVTERFTRTGPDTIVYQATMEDPNTWAQPWTIEYPMTRTDDEWFEYACHEGNYGMQNIMRAQRAQEAAEAAAKAAGTTK